MGRPPANSQAENGPQSHENKELDPARPPERARASDPDAALADTDFTWEALSRGPRKLISACLTQGSRVIVNVFH